MRRMGISIRLATWLGAVGILLLVIVGCFFVWRFVSESLTERAWADHSHEVVETLLDTENSLFRAVSERNTILLFDQSHSRNEMDVQIAKLESGIATLVELTGDSESQGARVRDLRAGVAVLVGELRRPFAAPLPEDRDALMSQASSATQLRNALLLKFAGMINAERDLLVERTDLSKSKTVNLILLLVATLLVAAAFAVLALWGINRHLKSNAARIGDLEHSKAALDLAYRELAASQQHLQSVLDYANDAIFLIGPERRVKLANRAAASIFGVALDRIVDAPITALVPDFRESGGEASGRREDGSRFPVDISIGAAGMGKAGELVCILRDATERHRLNQLKSEFVSTVSHELRTPLTSIRGSLGLVIGGMAGVLPEKAREFLEIAHNNSGRLVHLVNDILDIEKIESGRMEFRREWTSARRIVAQALDANRSYGDQLGVSFVLVGDGEADAYVHADGTRLQQVMANLLSNAAKFSPAGAVIEVEIAVEATQVRISIRDHGPGIPEDFRPRIFQRFAQADSSDMRTKGGTGLGLSITKAIIDHHNGTVGFETPPDGGARFYFTLPRQARPAATVEADPTAPQGSTGRRVLIVEDDPDVGKLLGLMLAQSGWQSQIAYSAKQALEWLDRGGFDAITLDIMLPDDDGLSLFRQLRARPDTRSLPVVIVSARADEARQALNGDAIGIIDWIEKPIDQDRLQKALRGALRKGGGPVRILHVEDDPDIVQVIGAVMNGEAEVIAAQTLAEARDRLAADSYSLVIIDIGLPDGSGLDLIDTIRKMNRPPPILIFSARDYDSATASQVAASLVKSRTDNSALHNIIQSLIDGADADHGR